VRGKIEAGLSIVKLRLHDNSIRVRLNRAELARFAADYRVTDSISFGPAARFTYSLEIVQGSQPAHAVYESGSIRILVPVAEAQDWIATDRVGIDSTPSSGPRILLEKDFQCLHGDEIEPDAFPNPLTAAQK